MASRYAVETVFKAVDNMTKPIQKMEGSMKGLGGVSKQISNKVKGDLKAAERQLNQFGESAKRMTKMALVASIAAAGAAVVDSTKKYIEFEDSITQAGAKFKDLDVTSETFQEDLEKLQKAAMEVGSKTKFSAQQAAGALDKMAMAGLTTEQSIGMLMGTTNLAAATNTDLISAVDMATDAMGAFNLVVNDPSLTAEEVAKQTETNMNRIADVVARTTNMANTDMSMWFEAVKSGAPQFTALGGNIETFSAAIGTLANSGIKGGEAGTALRNIMLRLSAPAKAGSEALSELGISVFDSQGKMLPFLDIMRQFETNLAGVADEKKAKLLSDIFGSRAIGSFQVLMSAGTDELQRFTEELYNAGGTAENVAGAMNKSLKGQITLLQSAVEGLQLNIGKAVAENGGSEGLQKIIEMVNNVNVDSLTQAIIGLMNVLGGVIQFFIGFAQVVWALRGPIIAIVGAITLYKSVIMGTVIAMKAWEAIQVIIKAAQIGWVAITQGLTVAKGALAAAVAAETAAMTAETTATTAATAAQTGFNLAMLANPVTWIVLGIIALIAAIVALAMNWDKVTAAMQTAWEWIKNVASAIWDNLVGAIQGVWEPFSKIIGAFQGGGFLAGIKQIGVSILNWVLTPIKGVLTLLSKIPGIGGKFADMKSGIDNWIENMSYQGEESVAPEGPVTQADRTVYSESNTTNNSNVTIGLEKGLTAQTSGPAPGVTINTGRSGKF